MEIWKQIVERIIAWNSTNVNLQKLRVIQICKVLDDKFLIFKKEHVKEFLLKDGYKVYLVDIKQIEEDAELDKWADKKEQEQIELNDSLSMSLDEKNDRITGIYE
jgi:hypothetical protein